MSYIESAKDETEGDGCLFCDKLAARDDARNGDSAMPRTASLTWW